MSILPTALQVTAGANNINAAQAHMIPRTVHVLTRAEFVAAVAAQRAFIADLGLNGWIQGERVQIVGEAGERIWTAGGAGTASHARLVEFPNGAQILLGSDDNTVTRTAGAPSSSGSTSGDKRWDQATGLVYTWTTVWDAGTSLPGSVPAAAIALPTQIPASTVIPLDGSYVMALHTMAGPRTYTFGSMAPGGSCVLPVLSDLTNTPILQGAKPYKDDGYLRTQAGLLNICNVWTVDGVEKYFSWTQPDSDTPADTTRPTITSIVVAAGTSKIVLTASEVLSSSINGLATLGGPARTIVSQTVVAPASSGVGSTIEIVVSADYLAGDAPTISWPAGWVRDTAAVGNDILSGTNRAVTVTTGAGAESQAMRLVNITNLTEGGDATTGWNYKGTSGADYTGYGASVVAIPAGGEGYFEVRQPSTGGASIAILGLKTSAASQNYTGFAYAAQPLLPGQGSQRYIQITGSSPGAAPNGATVLTALGQIYRIGKKANGAAFDGYIEVSSDNGATFSLVHTWAGIPDVPYYCGLSTGSSANNATNLRSLGAV